MQMPTVREWLSQVQADLRDGRSVVIVLPDGVDVELLRSALWNAQGDLYFEGIFLSQLDGAEPAAAVERTLALGMGASAAPTVEHLVNRAGLPDVLFLDDFDELAEGARAQWLRFMMQWADVCHGRRFAHRGESEVPPVLCLVAHAAMVPHAIALSDLTRVLLAVQVWWGLPTTLEMRLLCRLAFSHDGSSLNRWQEYMIPSIAGPDLCLTNYMLAQEYHTGAELTEILRRFAVEKNWSDEELEDAWRHGSTWDESYGVQGRLWTYPFFQAWTRGMLYWTPEYGLECHSAVLALLDRIEIVEHRVWRGQAQLMLPQIDEVRLALCVHFTNSYGVDWPYRWLEPRIKEERQTVRQSPFSCQWGHLEFLLRECAALQSESRWYSLVHYARRIRNDLSHYRSISLHEYERLSGEVRRWKKAGTMMAVR